MPSPTRTRPLKPAKDGLPPKQVPPRKRQPSGRISAACEACKKRKTKCTGGPPPCQLCETLGTDCIIDLSLDMRRRAALQRTLDESRSYQESLTSLLVCLRDGDPDIIDSLIEALRRDPTPQETSALIQHYLQEVHGRAAVTGNEDVLVSPSDDSTDHQQAFQHHSHLKTKSEDQLDWAASGTSTSSSTAGSKGKETGLTGYYVLLFQKLRGATTNQGERMLKRLVNFNDLAEYLQYSHADTSTNLGGDTSMMHAEGVESMSLDEDRKNWHPALQLGPDSSPSQQMADKGRNASLGPGVQIISVDSRPDGDQPESTPTVVGPSTVPPITARRQSFVSRSPSGPGFMVPVRAARTPYAEHVATPLKPGDSDLCVAHEDPASRWRIPIHLVYPLTVPDGSSMCRVYTDYLQAAKKMMLDGHPGTELLGSTDDVYVDLLFRQRQPDDKWNCSSWACELFRSFTEYDVYVRLANALFLTRLMRWLLVPSVENYAKLPDMMKPTATQRTVPHIGAIDLIPIPCIRDAAIANLRDWLTPLREARWTVNWPFSEQDAMERDPLSSSTRLTTRFIEHVTRYENWSVGASFLTTFPEVADRLRIHL